MLRATVLGFGLLAMVGTVAPQEAAACGDKAKQARYKVIGVDELAQGLSTSQRLTLVDANGAETRDKFGVIPGAKLLSSYRTFEPARELPAQKDARLVFYCAASTCSAAPTAAEKAIDAGYTNVSVLEAGIKGWVAAGHKTSRPGSA